MVLPQSPWALLAISRGENLRVARELWPRLVLAAILNVGCWMVLMGFALLWLPASEAALIAYTMPVWASILAWPILGERPNLLRVISLLMAFLGLSAILGGNGFAASVAKLPGIIMALCGAIGFAVGTVLAKKLPLGLPPVTAAAWQIGVGCLPVAIAGFLIENAHLAGLSQVDWMLLAYSTVIQFCVAYVCWFAALARLPASVAAIGTMAVPVIGVIASALALHEPLGMGQIAATRPAVTFVGVAGLDQLPAMQQFVAKYPVKGFTNLADTDGSVWAKFGVTHQPAFAFIRADGGITVVKGGLSEPDLDQRVTLLTQP